MLLLDVVQNSPEWYALRRTKIGASDCAGIVSKNPYSSPYKVWTKKIFGEEEFINGDMQRGIDLEDEARKWISEKHGIPYKAQCIQSEKRAWQIASMDGFFRQDGLCFAGEIKSPRRKKLLEIRKKGIPEYWEWQVQHQLSVLEMERIFMLFYTPEDQHLIWIHRNQDMISHLNGMEEVFYTEYLSKFVPPPLSELEENYVETLKTFQAI